MASARKAQIEKSRADDKVNQTVLNLYGAHMNLAQSAWEGNRPGATLPEFRLGWEWCRNLDRAAARPPAKHGTRGR